MGGRQVVRHGSLEPAFVGSSPTRPALQEKSAVKGLANSISFPPRWIYHPKRWHRYHEEVCDHHLQARVP